MSVDDKKLGAGWERFSTLSDFLKHEKDDSKETGTDGNFGRKKIWRKGPRNISSPSDRRPDNPRTSQTVQPDAGKNTSNTGEGKEGAR